MPGRMFRPLPHDRCACEWCMEVREENQSVRLLMGWLQPEFVGAGFSDAAS